jgi:hypothetical protein
VSETNPTGSAITGGICCTVAETGIEGIWTGGGIVAMTEGVDTGMLVAVYVSFVKLLMTNGTVAAKGIKAAANTVFLVAKLSTESTDSITSILFFLLNTIILLLVNIDKRIHLCTR